MSTSRLEGSIWDGSLLIYEVVEEGSSNATSPSDGPQLKLKTAHRVNNGAASLAFGGTNGELLAAGQDNGEIGVSVMALWRYFRLTRGVASLPTDEDLFSMSILWLSIPTALHFIIGVAITAAVNDPCRA